MNSQLKRIFPLSLKQMKIRVPRSLALASAKGKGEAESCSSLDALFGDNTSTECTWSFEFPESKVDFPHLESEAYLSGGSIGDQNVATVLEKLNALRSHLLAAEKWNASRLHSCDRFVEIAILLSPLCSDAPYKSNVVTTCRNIKFCIDIRPCPSALLISSALLVPNF